MPLSFAFATKSWKVERSPSEGSILVKSVVSYLWLDGDTKMGLK